MQIIQNSSNYGKKAARLIVVHSSNHPNFITIGLDIISQMHLDAHSVRDIIGLLDDERHCYIAKFFLMRLSDKIVVTELVRALKDSTKNVIIKEILQFHEPSIVSYYRKTIT